MKKIIKCFRDFTLSPHQGSATDLLNYLMMLGAGRDYRLRKTSYNKGVE